jgi:alkaline phosphatase D
MCKRLPFALAVGTAALVFVGGIAPSAQPAAAPLVMTHGIASGDVTASSSVIWARASGPGRMHVDLDRDHPFRRSNPGSPVIGDPFRDRDDDEDDDGRRGNHGQPASRAAAMASEATDFTAHVTVNGLRPDTRYSYRVWFTRSGGPGVSQVSNSLVGTFRTAPARNRSRDLSFVVGADVGGQQYCRNVRTGGYAIFAAMLNLKPDFFISNGDFIYADGECPEKGPADPAEPGGFWHNIPGDFPSIADPKVEWTNAAQVRDVYLRHYRYNRADPFMQSFLQATPMISQWDDHEVINDFGAPWTYWNTASITRAGYPNLVAQGLDTFFAYSPIARNRHDPKRIYRSFRWGRDLEIFVLDARSYRDRNDLPDTPENHKQMLGREQIDWLVDGIRDSTATWKVVSSDVPISIPTGTVQFGRDAWANLGAEPTGFERELLRLLRRLDRIDAENVVFVTTDVHNAHTIMYDIDADGDGDHLRFHELVSGPLNAVRNLPKALDPAANPTTLYAEGNIRNFNYVRIEEHRDGKAHLIADVRDETGNERPGSRLELTPR